MLGDAAFVPDPASFYGVLKAIMSGMMAVYAIAKILQDHQPESVVIQGYSDWISDWFQQDILKLKQFCLKKIAHYQLIKEWLSERLYV